LQTASNPYITIVGPIESAAKRISIMGICNKVAGALAPIALGTVILSNAEGLKSELVNLDAAARAVRLDELASRVVTPYTLMAVVLVILGIGVRMSPLPEIDLSGEQDGNDNTSKDKPSVWAYPNLVLGVIALFLYVGAEVIAGDTIANYGTSQGISLDEAKYFTTYTLAGMIIGYILGILLIPKVISQATALAASAITGIIFSILITLTDSYTSVLFVALLGFANALVWPAIWPLAIDGLGRHTKIASALLIMAIAGGALLPQVYGQLSEVASIGPKMAYLLLIPCYLFVLLYGRVLYKRKNW
jgi:glucose/galactose transporter